MRITEFAKKIAGLEAGKKQVSIAQISEILTIVNALTKGFLYAIIRSL